MILQIIISNGILDLVTGILAKIRLGTGIWYPPSRPSFCCGLHILGYREEQSQLWISTLAIKVPSTATQVCVFHIYTVFILSASVKAEVSRLPPKKSKGKMKVFFVALSIIIYSKTQTAVIMMASQCGKCSNCLFWNIKTSAHISL